MKLVIAIVVYNRIGNLIKWLKVAKKVCNQRKDVEFRVIHNYDKLEISNYWKKVSSRYPVTFIQRLNRGLDIGAFQDICLNRLIGFNLDFDFLAWFTDDCIPTSVSFIDELTKPFFEQEKIGLSCFELSTQIRPHVRTTGFCLKKETLHRLSFSVPVILTKQNCYDFEHGQNSLYMQIIRLGLLVYQIQKPIFYNQDSVKVKVYGLVKSLSDLYQFLYNDIQPRVLVFSTAYNRYPQIISSVICQKYKNWLLEIWHDGKIQDVRVKMFFDAYKSIPDKILYKEVGESSEGNYGHHLKKKFLDEKGDMASEYVVITNEDNYLSPYFLEKAISALEKHPEKIGAYCNGMVHNYKPDEAINWQNKPKIIDGHVIDGYGLIPCRIERGYIDISCLVYRLDIAYSIPWVDFSHSSDWDYIENIANNFGGKENFVSFPGIHLVHN